MEFVYVVPREVLFPSCLPQGFLPFRGSRALSGESDGQQSGSEQEALWSEREFHGLVAANGFFVERARAEITPAWKQIIPYALCMASQELLLVQRMKGGGESRLHNKLSIGIGGHVEPVDAAAATQRGELNPLAAGSRRELEEELDIQGDLQIRSAGILNDDSNPVGAVHLGLVQVAEVDGTVQVREKDILSGRMVSQDELGTLQRDGANFETWSEILIGRLGALLPSPLSIT